MHRQIGKKNTRRSKRRLGMSELVPNVVGADLGHKLPLCFFFQLRMRAERDARSMGSY